MRLPLFFTAVLSVCYTLGASAQSTSEICENPSIAFFNPSSRQQICPYNRESVEAMKKPLKDLDTSIIIDVGNSYNLNRIFTKHNDPLFNWETPDASHSSSSHAIVSRPLTWTYPDDGCYLRAQLFIEHVSRTEKQHLLKIFIFSQKGETLRAKTNNHPNGYVDWWYHVAPITRVGNTIYVIDPAISPLAPMPLAQWIDALHYQKPTTTKQDLRFAICDLRQQRLLSQFSVLWRGQTLARFTKKESHPTAQS